MCRGAVTSFYDVDYNLADAIKKVFPSEHKAAQKIIPIVEELEPPSEDNKSAAQIYDELEAVSEEYIFLRLKVDRSYTVI